MVCSCAQSVDCNRREFGGQLVCDVVHGADERAHRRAFRLDHGALVRVIAVVAVVLRPSRFQPERRILLGLCLIQPPCASVNKLGSRTFCEIERMFALGCDWRNFLDCLTTKFSRLWFVQHS